MNLVPTDSKDALLPRVRIMRAFAGYWGISAKAIAERAGKTPQSVSRMWNEHDEGVTLPLVWACNDALLDLIGEAMVEAGTKTPEDLPLSLYSNALTVERLIIKEG